jgi:hypothetical protein
VTKVREILCSGGTVGQKTDSTIAGAAGIVINPCHHGFLIGITVDLAGVNVIATDGHTLHTGTVTLVVDLGNILVLSIILGLCR